MIDDDVHEDRLMARNYRSVVRQSLHYLARPHARIPRHPVVSPAAWRGDELETRSDWWFELDARQLDELDRAIAITTREPKPLAALTRSDFPLPTLGPEIARWARILDHGLGIQMLRGLPVTRWSADESALVFWCLGLHLGMPGAQNGAGDLLGHVRDEGLPYDSADAVRGYRTSAALSYHCDFADVVGLLCLHPARSGGASRFVSSVTVFNELIRRRPDLVPRLFEPVGFDTRGDAGVDWVSVTPCRFDAGQLRTTYHADYMRSVERYPDAEPLDGRLRALFDTIDEIASAPGLSVDVEFQPGDVQLLSNHTVLHARTGYDDHPEPERRRHLLRLWLSLSSAATVRGRIGRVGEYLRLLSDVGVARIRRSD